MELEVRFISGGKYIEITMKSGNATMTSGFLNKEEAKEFIKQFTDLWESVVDMVDAK